MWHRAVGGLLVGTVLALADAVVGTPAAGATCSLDAAAIARADVTFVGDLTAATGESGMGTFAVKEVWGTAQLPPVVVVNGLSNMWRMPPPGGAAPTFVVLAEAVGGKLSVNQECDVPKPNFAFPWDPSFAAMRPATAHPPGSGTTDGGVPYQLVVVGGIVLLIGVVSAFAFRRTRAPV